MKKANLSDLLLNRGEQNTILPDEEYIDIEAVMKESAEIEKKLATSKAEMDPIMDQVLALQKKK